MSKIRNSLLIMAIAAFCAALFLAGFSVETDAAFGYGETYDATVVISKNPDDVTGVYGSVNAVLTVKLSDPNAIAAFAWYKSATEDGVAEKVSAGEAATPSLSVKYATDSGYYYCVIYEIQTDDETYKTNLVSSKAKVFIDKKPVEIELNPKEFVYNGNWQKPEVTVSEDDIESGDEVNASLSTASTAIDAGVYEATVSLDNEQYRTASGDTVSFEIKKAPLVVKINEVAVLAGQDYELNVSYEGFVNGEDESVLGFTPEIPSEAYGIKRAGIYSFACIGKSESANYAITYATSNIYVNQAVLQSQYISGINDATAGGSFRKNTRINVTSGSYKPNFFLKVVKYKYDIAFTSGGADGDTYVLNIKDNTISKFMLAVCKLNEDGSTERIRSYTQEDGILSVTLPTDETCSIVIYNDYTIIVAIGAILVIIFFVVVIVKVVSEKKYKRHLALYRAAEREANKYR